MEGGELSKTLPRRTKGFEELHPALNVLRSNLTKIDFVFYIKNYSRTGLDAIDKAYPTKIVGFVPTSDRIIIIDSAKIRLKNGGNNTVTKYVNCEQ